MSDHTIPAPTAAPPAEAAPPERARVSRAALMAAGLAGLVYWFAGWFSFPDGPTMSTATADQVREHVALMGGSIQGATGAGMVGVGASIVFIAALVRQVRDRLPASLLAEVVLGAGVLVIAYQWLMITAEGLLRLLPKLLDSTDLAAVSDETVLTWYALTGYTHFLGDLAIVPTALLIGAFSVAARRGRLLPSWLVWVGFVIAGAGAIGLVAVVAEVSAIYPFWFVGLIGFFFWTLAVSVVFLIRARRARREALATS